MNGGVAPRHERVPGRRVPLGAGARVRALPEPRAHGRQRPGRDPATRPGPTPFDTFPLPATFANRIETMYPFLFVNGGQATPHADDIAIFSLALSGAGLRDVDRHHHRPDPRAQRHARRSPASTSSRATSPTRTTTRCRRSRATSPIDYTPGAPFVGVYTLRGLTPGASYAVFVDEILGGRLQHAAALACRDPRSSTTAPTSRTTSSPTCRASFTPVVAVGRRAR